MDFWQVTLELLEGFLYTFAIFGITLATAIPIGLLVAFGSMSRFAPLKVLCRGLVWVIRGTPLMLQIIFFTVVPGLWLKIPIRESHEFFIMVCLAFAINYGCYFSEIFRGGIEGIPRGQHEAGQVLGLTKWQVFRHVVLLQVIKRIIPPMSNEIITLVKDTALASVAISIDMFTVAEHITNRIADPYPLFYAGLFYLVFNGLLTVLLSKIEKKLSYFN